MSLSSPKIRLEEIRSLFSTFDQLSVSVLDTPLPNDFGKLQVNGVRVFIKYLQGGIEKYRSEPNEETEELLVLLIKILNITKESVEKEEKGIVEDIPAFFTLVNKENVLLLIRNLTNDYLTELSKDGFKGLKEMMAPKEPMSPEKVLENRAEYILHGDEKLLKHLIGNMVSAFPENQVKLPRVNPYEIYINDQSISSMRKRPEHNENLEAIKGVYFVPEKVLVPDTLLFHVQGGAFQVNMSMAEPAFQYISNQLGIPILIPNYRLVPEDPYPAYIQDSLDAYFFAASGSKEAREMLGFNPKKIFVSGDSAGGQIAPMVVKCLELIQKEQGEKIQRPVGLYLNCPVFFSDMIFKPSSCYFTLFNDLLGFSPFYRFLIQGSGGKSFPVEWYKNKDDVKKIRNFFQQIVMKDPIRNVMYPDGFTFLKGMKMSILAAEADPLFDDSVILYRKCPKEYLHSFDIASREIHGAVPMDVLAKSPNYIYLYLMRIAEMMGLDSVDRFRALCSVPLEEQKQFFID